MIWDANDGRNLLTIRGNAAVYSVAFSPDSQRIACGFRGWTAAVWDAGSGKELVSFLGHDHEVRSVAFSPDGRRLVTGSDDQTAKVWETATGREFLTLAHGERLTSVAFSPDGRRTVTGSWGNTVRVWEAASMAEVEGWRREEQAAADYVAAQEQSRIQPASSQRPPPFKRRP
jgi:WD40 repeat protein